MKLQILFLVCSICSLTVYGQVTDLRYSEEEVTIEKQYIEAKKYKLLGDIDAAKDLLTQILKKYRNHDVAAYELAEIYQREESYEDALHHANLAVGIDTDNVWYYKKKAEILTSMQRFLDAADVYRQMHELQPDEPSYLHHMAFLYQKGGELDASIAILDQIENQFGISDKTALPKHDLYHRLKKKNKAQESLEALVERFPREIEYKHILANYLKAISKKSAAEEIYREILAQNPEDARANVALASDLKDSGDEKGYLSSIRKILENEEAGIDLKINELMPFVKKLQRSQDQGDLEELLGLIAILEKTNPDEAKSYALHADVLMLAGRDEDAIEKYKQTLALDESNFLVWEQMLLLQADHHQMEDLAKYSEQAMEIFPNQALLYYLNGLANIELQRYDVALDGLDQAVFMAGSNKDLKFNILALLGKVFHELNDFESSSSSYEEAMMLKPADPHILNDYSYHLSLRGEQLAEAEKMVDKALKKEPGNPRFLATKSWINYRMQKSDAALSIMEEAIKAGGENFSYILEKYGDLLFKQGETDKAIKQWEMALEKGGGSKLLERKINEENLIEEQ